MVNVTQAKAWAIDIMALQARICTQQINSPVTLAYLTRYFKL
jgi:hypothetical protein